MISLISQKAKYFFILGHANVVQVLLERFPALKFDQVNKLGQTALIKAAIQGRVSCAKLLLHASKLYYY